MLHNFLFTPFTDPRLEYLYGQLQAALAAEARPGTTLLLGNFAAEEGGEAFHALLVRPHSITLLVLVPRGGQLQVPALSYGAWQLAGTPLTGTISGADNPYAQFRRQKATLATWLGSQVAAEQANLHFITGLVVFAEPVTFGPGVEEQLCQQADGSLQLLSDLSQLPRRLTQLARPEIELSEADLTEWAHTLAQDREVATETPLAPSLLAEQPAVVAAEKPSLLRRAWSWLGAEDVPEDMPYGGPLTQATASTAEKQRLEQMQRTAQAQVQQQLQALEAREAEREQRIDDLRRQLAQASPVTSEAQALQERLAAESREKAALETAIRASRVEAEIRTRELDVNIAQLGQLIEQLSARTTAPGATPQPKAAQPTAEALQAAPASHRRAHPRERRRLARTVAVAGVAALLGGGAWGVSQLRNASSPSAAYEAAPVTSGSARAVEQHASGGSEKNEPVTGGEAPSPTSEAYAAHYPYANGYARVQVNGAYTYIDQAGQPFPNSFLEARDFSEGYAAVRDSRGWYYITGPAAEDPELPPFLFLEAYSFREGLARVRLKPGYTYITKRNLAGKGPSVFQLYEAATDFIDGRAEVTLGGRRFSIDTTGQPVE